MQFGALLPRLPLKILNLCFYVYGMLCLHVCQSMHHVHAVSVEACGTPGNGVALVSCCVGSEIPLSFWKNNKYS